MRALANSIRASYTERGQMEITLGLTTKEDISKLTQIIENKKLLEVEIKQQRRKRSLDANSYCWVLCQKIAEAIGSTKENVYKKAIREVGQFEIVPIKNEAVERWIEVWNSKGLGWFAEILEDSKLPGYKKVISYYGSSVYDTREMSVLLEEIIREAKELGIDTITENEKREMISLWGIKEDK